MLLASDIARLAKSIERFTRVLMSLLPPSLSGARSGYRTQSVWNCKVQAIIPSGTEQLLTYLECIGVPCTEHQRKRIDALK